MLASVTSGIKNMFAKEFGRREAKDYLNGDIVKNQDNIVRDKVDIARIGKLAGAGAGIGALVGGATGGILAARAINRVPVQSISVDYRAPSLHSERLGMVPADDYVPTPGWSNGMSLRWGYPSFDRGVPTIPVVRNNPTYGGDNHPVTLPTSETFSGHGTPSVSWDTKNISHYTMNGYQRSVTPHTESVYDHTDRWTEQEPYTVYETRSESYQNCTSQYNSDGSTGQDCRTESRNVQVGHTEYRTVDRERRIYRDELRGFYERYSPNVASRVVGTYQAPRVSFDHGINTASYILKGVLIGAGIGALALGVAGALEDKYFPGVLPGHKEKSKTEPLPPSNPGTPYPGHPAPPTTEPLPPVTPAPYYGEVQTHAHESRRHSHAGGNLWHFHGCPGDGHDALDTSIICFKPNQVPSGYKTETPTECEGNGSVCYLEKGVGAA